MLKEIQNDVNMRLKNDLALVWLLQAWRGTGWAVSWEWAACSCSPWPRPCLQPPSFPRTTQPTRPSATPTMCCSTTTVAKAVWTTAALSTSSASASSLATRTALVCAPRMDPCATSLSAQRSTPSAPRWSTTAAAPSARSSRTFASTGARRTKYWRSSRWDAGWFHSCFGFMQCVCNLYSFICIIDFPFEYFSLYIKMAMTNAWLPNDIHILYTNRPMILIHSIYVATF